MTGEERRELIASYRRAAQEVVEIASALDPESMDREPVGGGWTPRSVLHHVADTEVMNGGRLYRLLAEDAPFLPAFDQEAYASRLRYERLAATSLAVISALVDSNVDLLERLDDEDWRREGRHEELGSYSVERWLVMRYDHCRQHADQLRAASPHGSGSVLE
jgi:hypothetical protein